MVLLSPRPIYLLSSFPAALSSPVFAHSSASYHTLSSICLPPTDSHFSLSKQSRDIAQKWSPNFQLPPSTSTHAHTHTHTTMSQYTKDSPRKLRDVADYIEREVQRSESVEGSEDQDSSPLNEDLKGILSAVEEYLVSAESGRRQSIVIDGTMELNMRDYESIPNRRTSFVVRKGSVRLSLVAPQTSNSITSSVSEKIIGTYSKKPTGTVVVFEPRLQSGVIHDREMMKDKMRNIPVLGFIVEEALQPIASFFYFIPSLLSVAWGPFAIAALCDSDFGGPKFLYDISLIIMVLRALGLIGFVQILMLDYHRGVALLLLRNNFVTVFINLGSRLLYSFAAASYFPNSACNVHLLSMFFFIINIVFIDCLKVTHMLRFNREGYENLYGPGALASKINNFSNVLVLMFECARRTTHQMLAFCLK